MTIDFFSLRSLLFTPGNKPERFDKAKKVGADGIILDLEDGVGYLEKQHAREIVINYLCENELPATESKQFLYTVRINSLQTVDGLRDILALLESGLVFDALIVPKVETAGELIILDSLFSQFDLPYFITIETALGLRNIKQIVTASTNIKGLFFGGADYAADIGASFDWEAMLMARTTIVQMAASINAIAMDVPYLNTRTNDFSQLKKEVERVAALGYTAKLAIHPTHIQPIIEAFMPSIEEINNANEVIKAYEHSKGQACVVDGEMVDVPVYLHAKRLLSRIKR